MDLFHRLILVVSVLCCFCRCQMTEREEVILILKNIFDRQTDIMQKLQDMEIQINSTKQEMDIQFNVTREELHNGQKIIQGSQKGQDDKVVGLEMRMGRFENALESSQQETVSSFKSVLTQKLLESRQHLGTDWTSKKLPQLRTLITGSTTDIKNTVSGVTTGVNEMQAKLSVLEDLEEVIGAVHERFNMNPVSEFKNLLTTDECQDGTHKCSENAVCTDEVIQYTCTCLLGFSGDGFTCKDPCIRPSIHLTDVGCVVPTTYCQWPSINLPDLGCITPIFDYMSWYKAKELCEESGKRLIEDIDATHMKLLSELYLPMMKDNKQPWIGAMNSKWLTSQDALADNLWKEGEPDGGEEVCTYLSLGNTTPLGIADAKCSTNGRAFCQFRS